MKRLNSYLSEKLVSAKPAQEKGVHLPRMNFSKSLSRSASIIFVGGGWRTSFGLYFPFDLVFPICRMCYKTKG
jgi:hypothetical protein